MVIWEITNEVRALFRRVPRRQYLPLRLAGKWLHANHRQHGNQTKDQSSKDGHSDGED